MEIREIFEKVNKQLSCNLEQSIDNVSDDLGKTVLQINAFKCRSYNLEKELVDEIIYDLY